MQIKYKRVLLKLSGEALMDSNKTPIAAEKLNGYIWQIEEIHALGVQTGIVIGGGNIFRGVQGAGESIDRISGDYMGMLATVINSIAIHTALLSKGIKARLFTAIRMEPVGELYNRHQAIQSLENGEVVIFAAGTGNPFFTTDTAAALRAVEIQANILLKGTKVDGIYSADPAKDKNAIRYEQISFDEVYAKNLHVMDMTSFTMCRDNQLPIIVFNINKQGNLKDIVTGKHCGTLVS